MDTRRPSILMMRWLALGAAAGAAAALAVDAGGWSGPWQMAALVLVLLAVFAIVAFIYAVNRREQVLQQVSHSAQRGQVELDEMKRELDRHTVLEQQLRQAKHEAESAVMAKGEFLATMSHEIRTPLNGIVPMLDLLMHAPLAPDHAELVRTAYVSSQQMLRIVDDILDYSKLESDRLELETTTFNVRELLDSVLQMMERPAQSKGLRLNLQLDPGVRLPVRGDPVRLRQVLSNLISNAVKFTERGGITVIVRRVGETTARHQLRFEVRDTGIGISPEAQPRLFRAFSQADASTTRLYGGTGLGLAISKRIVDLMGGEIGVQSVPQQGATFWFEIPLLKVQGDMPARTGEATQGRLLLLSADPRLRLRLSMLLPNWGLRVTSVETTQEALDRLRAAAGQGAPWTYSIVLADLSGMRNTALALHRNLERSSIYGQLRLVCLYGDDPVPAELKDRATLLSRQAPDADLRALLTAANVSAPVVRTPAPAQVAREPAPVAAASKPFSGDRTPRVLLVEDNPVNLMVGQRLLLVLGIDCDTAGNGEAALMRMSASRYDIVLMDCQMPVMDGYTATRRWREEEAAAGDARRLPIIAMTANAMAGDRQKCLDAGMDDYLAKPVTRSELERCLQHWWDPQDSGLEFAREERTGESAPPVQPPAELAPSGANDGDVARIAGEDAQRDNAVVHEPPNEAKDMSAPATPARDPVAVPVVDTDVLEDLRELLGGEVERLVQVFLEDAPRLIAALENAAAGPDYDALRDAAHSLKSSSANLGAMQLSAAAKRIEHGARERSLDRPAVAVTLLSTDFSRARAVLLAQTRAGAAMVEKRIGA